MKTAKFMFINKDAQSDSLSHSDKQERISIHSHVQKGRKYKKADRRTGTSPLTRLPLSQPGHRYSSSSRPNGQSSGSGSGDDGLVSTSDESLIKGVPGLVHRQSREQVSGSSRRQASGFRDDAVCAAIYSSNQSSTRQWIPVFPASASESFDPFDVTCIRINGAVHSLLQYFLLVHHPNIWHIERAVRVDHKYAFRSDAMSVIQGCLHDEYNMYALLASMASYMTYIDEIASSASADGSYYIHKALKASQQYVYSHRPITGRMIFNVFHLGCAEWYRYNVDAAYVHLKAAKQLVDSMGGLQVLDAPLVDLLLTGDGYVAAELRRPPLWSATDFESGGDDDSSHHHPMAVYGLCELQKLLSGEVKTAAGLLRRTQQQIVPTSLRWIILDLAVVLSVLLRSSPSPSSVPSDTALEENPPPDALHWIHIRTLAIRHRLLAMDLSDPRTDAIRTALVLWIFQIFTVSGRKRSIKIIAPFLRETLLTIADHLWHGHEDMRLWILSVGSLSARSGTDSHKWFVAELSRCLTLTRTGVLNNCSDSDLDPDAIFKALVVLSHSFFYLEPVQTVSLRVLAKDIHNERHRKKTRV